MAKKSSGKPGDIDWKQVTDQIVASLDVVAEYASLGVEVVDKTPNSKGWVSCRAFGRSDRSPSAGIEVATGRYHDFGGGGESMLLWDFAVKAGRFPDWREAREHYASLAGIDLPKSKKSGESGHGGFRFSALKPGTTQIWCSTKPPISRDAVELAGGQFGLWPTSAPEDMRQLLICWPMWGADGISGSPTAWHCMRVDGSRVNLGPNKTTAKMTKGSPGLLNSHGVAGIAQASVIWLVEGLTSMLALQTLLGGRSDHVVLSPGACTYAPKDSWAPLFKGKDVRIVFDVDENGAGQKGAGVWLSWLMNAQAKVRNVVLPGPAPIDLRDWILSGGTYDTLLAMSEQVEAKTGTQRTVGTISNAVQITENGSTRLHVKDAHEIYAEMKGIAGDWPRRVGRQLFVDRGGEKVTLNSAAELLGWLVGKTKIEWHNTPASIAKNEFFNFVRQNARRHIAVQDYPHYPPIKDHYYLDHGDVPTGDGSTVRLFIDRFFNPESVVDLDLIYAAVMTLFWGGRLGTRPAFLITTNQGVGAGKTSTAQAIAWLAGGTIDTSKDERVDDLKKRILSDESGKRAILVDNVKAETFSWSAFESLITASHVSGHRMYVGQGEVPNIFTWFITLNSPSLGNDMSARVIPIYVRKPKLYGPKWQAECYDFIEANRMKMIGDAKWFFSLPAAEIPIHLRWGNWACDVLGRMPDPIGTQEAIIARQAAINAEANQGVHLEELVANMLQRLEYDPETQGVFIPADVMAKWAEECFDEFRISKAKIHRKIKQGRSEGIYRFLIAFDNAVRHEGGRSRGYVWYPDSLKSVPSSLEGFERRIATDIVGRMNGSYSF